MTCRDEILDAILSIIGGSTEVEFTVREVIEEMQRRGTRYKESTIRTHVTSRMCANAPDNHPVTYDDLLRTGRASYVLADGEVSARH